MAYYLVKDKKKEEKQDNIKKQSPIGFFPLW